MHADTVITNIDWLITVDDDRRIIRDAGVAITDGVFKAVGKSADIVRDFSAELTVEASNRVATPGLIDSHLHSSFQLARGLADELGTRPFLFERMFPYEGVLSEEDVHVSALFTAMSLLRCGVTCFIDPGNYHPAATARAASVTGIRAVLGRSAFDMTKAVLGVLPSAMIETTEEALERTQALIDFVEGQNDPKLTASVSFRGLSNASDVLITGCKELAEAHACILQTHACFNYSTRDDCLATFGATEIERMEALGVLDERTLLVHSGWLEPRDIQLVTRRNPSLVAAPSSTLHNGYGNFVQGRLPELMELGINLGIGSDHACSGTTDLVQEMLLFAGTHKEIHSNPRVVPPEQVIEMATMNGARCAGLSETIGSVEVGKDADLTLFDTTFPEWQPLYNPISNLVYSATGNSVADVFVAGEHVVQDGHLTAVQEADVLAEVHGAMARIGSELPLDKIAAPLWPVQ